MNQTQNDFLQVQEDADGVLLLTLNDPSTRNSLGAQLHHSLTREIDRFARTPELKSLVITGAGTAFCSGANVRGFRRRIEERESSSKGPTAHSALVSPWEQLDPVYAARESHSHGAGPEIVKALSNLAKPSIAAVNGAAYGLGCGLALSCDFRIASSSATFCEAFIHNGLIPADGSSWQLPKLIGISETLRMQMFGEVIDSADSYRIGLVNKVVPDTALLDTAMAWATRLAKGPIFAMGLIKQLVRQGHEQSLSQHLALASRAQEIARQTDDHKEGVEAFLNKRQPRFGSNR